MRKRRENEVESDKKSAKLEELMEKGRERALLLCKCLVISKLIGLCWWFGWLIGGGR